MHDYTDFAEEIEALETDVNYWEGRAKNFEALLKDVAQILEEYTLCLKTKNKGHASADSLTYKTKDILADINNELSSADR